MENKEDKNNQDFFKSNESTSWEWLIGLILVSGIFSDKGSGFNSIKEKDTESRISKLEAKIEMLEKIVLK